MVLLSFLAQNCAMGLAFGSFGPLLASTEQHFGVSRAVAASGMSALMLALGLLSPAVGGALQRVQIRTVLMSGAAISAGGYFGLAFSSSFPLALCMFVLVGAGVCLLGVIAPLTLITRWFTSARARALSIVNLPILLFVTPFAIAEVLPVHGRTTVLLTIAAIFASLVPLMALVIERPEQVGQQPWGADHAASADVAAAPASRLSPKDIVFAPSFWIVSLGVGVIAGTGSAYVVHIIAFGVAQQMSLQQAAMMLSIYSGSGILGSLVFGWLADRYGPVVALSITAFFQAALWLGLVLLSGSGLLTIAALMGICVVPINTLHGASIGALFGPANVSRVMGFSYLVKLPFLFTFAPLAGLLFDRSGSYTQAFLMMSGLLLGAWVLFLLLIYLQQRRPRMILVRR